MGAGQKQTRNSYGTSAGRYDYERGSDLDFPGMADQEGQNLILLLSVPRKAIISPVPENSFAEIVSLLSLRHFQSF
jgi:hypothetical protein